MKKKYLASKSVNIVNFNGIKKFLQDYLFEDFRAEFLTDDPDLSQTIKFLVMTIRYFFISVKRASYDEEINLMMYSFV